MNTQSPASRGQLPHTPRRQSVSTEQRPATSGGERIEPTSAFLRDALRERKGLPTRARSTTPRRVRTGQRAQIVKDEWLQSSGDEASKRATPSATRPVRPRRASDITAAKSTPPVTRGLGSREADARIDRLEKENWNLKHRIMLYQERAKRMEEELEKKNKEIERLDNVEYINNKLEDEIESLKENLEASQTENTSLQDTNVELTQINEEIVQQLEQRVVEMETLENDAVGRQSAIEEAAGIIQMLEQRLIEADERLRRSRHPTSLPQTDSDYFSSEVKPLKTATKPSPSLSNPPQLAPDSDYFSADTSPLITPRSVKQAPAAPKNSPQQLLSAKETSAVFIREMGIKSVTSKDSLFSMYLETPDLPQKSSATSGVNRLRSLRKRNETGKNKLSRTPENPKPTKVPQAWSDTRPLRNLYMNGELGLQVSTTKELPSLPTSHTQSHQGPYSTSPPRDQYGEPKSRSNPSISVTQPDSRTVPINTAGARGSQHVRSNSTSTKPPAHLIRHNTAPTHTSPPRTSPHSTRAQPTRILPVPYQPSHPSNSTPPTVRSTAPISPTLSRQKTTPPHTRILNELSRTPEPLPTVISAPPTTYAAPPAQTAPTYSATKQTTQTHRAPATNPAFWPRRYPAWPPSAGLTNRNLLFHGDGLDEIFPGSPTKSEGEVEASW
jgi:hypothetical protein